MTADPRRKVTTRRLVEMKSRGEQIAALTAYDQVMASLLDAAGIDLILVGDSAAMVVQGLDTTLGVTMDHMLYHAALVTRGVKRALVVGDMPFMSFQVNPDEALRNAGRLVKESGVEAVKLSARAAWANLGNVIRLVCLDVLATLAAALMCYLPLLLVIPVSMFAKALLYRRVFPGPAFATAEGPREPSPDPDDGGYRIDGGISETGPGAGTQIDEWE